jgi:tetratricopeptide (TPR) repeat protein
LKPIAYFILFLTTIALHAQQDLVSIDQLRFSSDFEESAFKDVLGDDPDYFLGFMTLAADTSMVSQWRGYYQLRVKRFLAKKRSNNADRDLKNAYKYVHDAFFRKYESLVNFERIFEGGVYNCVTACALYGMAFDDFGIPYVIKETPTHVYIIAYPESSQIRIETTNPLAGYQTFSPGFKEGFVKNLMDLKLIDLSDMARGVNAIFDEYYFTAPNLGLRELLGIHYYNQAVVVYSDHNYEKAFEILQKAYFLHPSESMKEMMAEACLMMLNTSKYEDMFDVDALITAMKIDHSSVRSPQILSEFARMIRNQLIEKNDTAYVDEAFLRVSAAVTDSVLLQDMSSLYYYERCRIHYNKGNYRKALPYAIKAYGVKPSFHESETVLVGCIQNGLNQRAIEPEDAEVAIDSLCLRYDQLNKNAHLNHTRAAILLQGMAEAYDRGEVTEAKDYQAKFAGVSENTGVKVNEQNVGYAYSRGVIYYFKKGWYKSARQVLNEGLKYAPSSSELKTRKYYLDRAQN